MRVRIKKAEYYQKPFKNIYHGEDEYGNLIVDDEYYDDGYYQDFFQALEAVDINNDFITVRSWEKEFKCPHCGEFTTSVHSYHKETSETYCFAYWDKVIINFLYRKFKCKKCGKIFNEPAILYKGKKYDWCTENFVKDIGESASIRRVQANVPFLSKSTIHRILQESKKKDNK